MHVAVFVGTGSHAAAAAAAAMQDLNQWITAQALRPDHLVTITTSTAVAPPGGSAAPAYTHLVTVVYRDTADDGAEDEELLIF